LVKDLVNHNFVKNIEAELEFTLNNYNLVVIESSDYTECHNDYEVIRKTLIIMEAIKNEYK